MARRRGYYRQFEELSPEEVSRELRERRDAARVPVRLPELDLSRASWHEPPHPEVINAATFALRRAVNVYADPQPLRAAVAAGHGVADARVVVGHGAGELLRAALHALARGGGVRVAWPGWGPLPGWPARPAPARSRSIRRRCSRRAAAGATRRPACSCSPGRPTRPGS